MASGQVGAEPATAPKTVEAILGNSPTFEQLQGLFDKRYLEWTEIMKAQNDLEEPQWVPPPSDEFFPYFQKAAMAGEADAMVWVLDNSWTSSMPRIELRDLKLHCVQGLAELGGNKHYLKTVAQSLMNEWDSETAVSWSTADQILRELNFKADVADLETRALLLFARYRVHESRPGTMGDALALQILKTLAKDFANTGSGSQAKGLLFRKQYLQVGMRAPYFSGEDVDGNPISLRDYKGKVVYLVFWGFW
jgi:hypothetical protein